MKFSTKSRYALRLMAELARYAPAASKAAHDSRQQIYQRRRHQQRQ